ncbi:MAG TPA: transposase [Verrucomicrobiae bacterium]|nr:transposase [Verrucomicrobiae bacterium]
MKRSVHEIIREKRQCAMHPDTQETAYELSIGSKGWHTRSYLPNFDQPGAIQMVTFRLADAMPASLRQEWEKFLQIEDQPEQRTALEAYLDQGRGACVLRDPRLASIVEAVLLRFDGARYRIAAWVVMPNHVHLLFELWHVPLGTLLKSWKGAAANHINRALDRTGQLWQADYWDRYMRDEEHFHKARHYIEHNPVKARLASTAEDWPFSSANPKWRWSTGDRYGDGHLLNP